MARKTPQQKKAESLRKDRRNAYGENSKASRKLVPKSKALSHRAERRVAREGLRVDGGEVDLEAADRAEVRRQIVAQYAFKKVPDAPLGEVLAAKAVRSDRRTAR
mgnify:CR=1 FL=1